ncbi:LysM peptidoglycan-binding domain-containing protein [Clostridium botulinum]|uniref:LysM peptidoglycan-binding domain-containing protein n=1 Tax=Clostridium botulinum TaxID=1491 RepID=A0A0L9Y6Y4_CLOBO|nr:LysM peptidoglycan-binding domain-containing protein [Clostridium botulinum]KAI3349216.1 LysM peptidoglycan-binding domain-containing protein [Clostridium botulinum]KOM87547.1 hypothetical protein ACP51_11380 [Clostridium botulinum]KOR61554.1 hypothetical protein ADT22_06020 [Clostridium botulinum]MCS6111242.1 LysM peptidoglycan-binding domain-containing protein [Clostridium botulinum]NFE10831.1 LysM peptidoglycan-binding domain-containing protein [Clostridium botulinum]
MNKKTLFLVILIFFIPLFFQGIFSKITQSNSKLCYEGKDNKHNYYQNQQQHIQNNTNKDTDKINSSKWSNKTKKYDNRTVGNNDEICEINSKPNYNTDVEKEVLSSENKQVINSDNNNINTNLKNTTKEKECISKQNINIDNYLDSLPCINYELKRGETLTDIARRYEENSNLNTTIKLIKSINKIDNENDIDEKTIIHIPESTIKSGKMYRVVSGDTWCKVAREYYSNYNGNSIMDFLVYINNLPNNDLPLGELIFLPPIVFTPGV